MIVEQVNSEGHVLYLHHDQQGSTRLITGESGKAEGAYTYAPYGGVESHSGAATSSLGYAGQYTNNDTGLIYMRARTYDPATAQFMSVDPLSAITRMPYAYADDNPVTLMDPRGLCSFFDFVCDAEAVGSAVGSGAEWVYEHPTESAGIALGVVSVATGVGALAAPVELGELTLGSTALGSVAAATGAGGAALDASACFGGSASNRTAACVGLGLNGAGSGLGLGATLMEAGILDGSATLKGLLEYGGLSAAVAGLSTDLYSDLSPELTCGQL